MDKLLEALRAKNPGLTIVGVEDPSFASYGCVHKSVQLPGMREFLYQIEQTEPEYYVPSEARIECLPEATQIADEIFGQGSCQIGWYYGRGDKLNAVEYHKCSEVLYEYEPCVLIVGHVWDIADNKVHSDTMKLFYVPANCCVELYATTLHYAPVRACQAPVMQIVAQSKDTNTPLLKPVAGDMEANPMLLQRNKWVLGHPEAAELLGPQACLGILGDNIQVIPADC